MNSLHGTSIGKNFSRSWEKSNLVQAEVESTDMLTTDGGKNTRREAKLDKITKLVKKWMVF